jgi:hypothetical protein
LPADPSPFPPVFPKGGGAGGGLELPAGGLGFKPPLPADPLPFPPVFPEGGGAGGGLELSAGGLGLEFPLPDDPVASPLALPCGGGLLFPAPELVNFSPNEPKKLAPEPAPTSVSSFAEDHISPTPAVKRPTFLTVRCPPILRMAVSRER